MNEYDYDNLCEIANSINDEFVKNTFLETIRRYNYCLKELQRKDNIIENIKKYTRTFKTNEITDRELCILNDILLITEEKENIVARLKEKSGK